MKSKHYKGSIWRNFEKQITKFVGNIAANKQIIYICLEANNNNRGEKHVSFT